MCGIDLLTDLKQGMMVNTSPFFNSNGLFGMKQTLGSILYTVNSCSANHCSNLFYSNIQYLLCFCLTLSLKNTLDQLLSAALFSGLESDCRYLVPVEEKDAGRKKKKQRNLPQAM